MRPQRSKQDCLQIEFIYIYIYSCQMEHVLPAFEKFLQKVRFEYKVQRHIAKQNSKLPKESQRL